VGNILATYYVLFFIHLESRRISFAGLTKHPTAEWIVQMALNATDDGSGSVACATFFTIGIPSSAPRFWMSCDPAAYGH
jgi:hypothetical protein